MPFSAPAGTQKVPQAEWEKEKAFLQPPVSAAISPPEKLPTYFVRKDNCIAYRGNYYSLPARTYRGKGTGVTVEVRGSTLSVYNTEHNMIAQHLIPEGKGNLIRNEAHVRMPHNTKQQTRKSVLELLGDKLGDIYLENLQKNRPRYFHDNLKVLEKNLRGEQADVIEKVLAVCLENSIYNASEFGQVLERYRKKQIREKETFSPIDLSVSRSLPDIDIQPQRSDINYYESIVQ